MFFCGGGEGGWWYIENLSSHGGLCPLAPQFSGVWGHAPFGFSHLLDCHYD